ncbi:MAG: hypothetical protein DDT30_02020 [Dehalococcoidia bacterium]|nr:hypothetical protein [Bacillota bacterium]
MNIEIEREKDGRWIAEIPDLPGMMTYRQSREEAILKVKALALRVLAPCNPITRGWLPDWNTARQFSNYVKCSRCRHESMAVNQSSPSSAFPCSGLLPGDLTP